MKRLAALGGLLLTVMMAAPASAIWHETRVPFTLILSDHTGSAWSAEIAQAAADWSQSTVLDIAINTQNGKLSVYDGLYGSTYPWAWTMLSYGGGYTKTATISLNDTYLDAATPDQRQHAICAELGNAISEHEGCRDRVTGEWFTTPTQADFDELVALYGP